MATKQFEGRSRIKDVAEYAGVSTATVSHVINGTRFVSEETKIKVEEAMRDLNYSPNAFARSLRSQQSNTIGLIIPVKHTDTSNFFFMTIAHGIESKLREHGYHLIFSNSNEDIEIEKSQIEVFNSQLVDGLIIAPTAEEHSYLSESLTKDYPVVFIDRRPSEYEGACVLVNNLEGTYKAIQHLIEKGHKKIGYISGPLGLTTSDERLAGYKAALNDNGIELTEHYVKVGDSTQDNGYLLTKELVESREVSALFIANNVMTLGAVMYLQEQKVSIPSSLAVIGFDDYEWTRITVPPLTVIKQPAFELGERAAEMILSQIKESDNEEKEVRLDTELIIRGSC
ncbi:LacI family transcriptional regulator [Mesobacillus subterraneus]|uniref:LacI family DNA-binding transcriptional regulator n=1 Tax=Mesobacillus subterraneus TaxID=285983 RepID=UPI00203C6C24|nr:LacI family DNA-binding transcriptional regulator [Mesobacillus subterraneus]MCM3575586.1 LacI family transcriptional regulator [Mesobacillus subterraneus]